MNLHCFVFFGLLLACSLAREDRRHRHARSQQASRLEDYVLGVSSDTFENPGQRISSPLATLPEQMTISIVAAIPLSRSNNCLNLARTYADNIIYSGLRDAARSILFALAVETADDADLLPAVTSYLRNRFPSAVFSIHEYDRLDSSASHVLWKSSISLSEFDARNHMFLYTGFSNNKHILATQVSHDVHAASSSIWPWKTIAKAFGDDRNIAKAGYACDSSGTLLFHHFWVRASFVTKLLPEPTFIAVSDYVRPWLEISAEVAGIDTTVSMTLSLCGKQGAVLKPGSCINVDASSAYPLSVMYACMCGKPYQSLGDRKFWLDTLDISQVSSTCDL